MVKKMKNINVVFMGTPTFAVPILESLIKNYNVTLVVSQPDREKDRKGNLLATPTKALAKEYNIEVFQPTKIKEDYQKIIDKQPDIIITCAYGQIIPDELLNYPKYGAINVHGSLLPKLRGGAPIHWALINGEKETGITIMYMSSKMDAGDIISQRKIPILDSDNLDTLYPKLSNLGRDLLMDTLPDIINNKANSIKQNEEEVTYGLNIKKEEEKIDFNQNANIINNKIRGLSSKPGAYCYLDNKRLKILKASITDIPSQKEPGTIEKITKDSIMVATNDYLLALKDIQIEGKKRCLVSDYLNGINKEELINKKLK